MAALGGDRNSRRALNQAKHKIGWSWLFLTLFPWICKYLGKKGKVNKVNKKSNKI